jgi:hypothetical protein
MLQDPIIADFDAWLFKKDPYKKRRPPRRVCEYKVECCPQRPPPRVCDVMNCDFRGPNQFGLTLPERGGTWTIGLCFANHFVFGNDPNNLALACKHFWETIRHELVHVIDQCKGTEDPRAIEKDKCRKCLCDELRAHWYSKQCKKAENSVWWWVLLGLGAKAGEAECLKKSAIKSCREQKSCPPLPPNPPTNYFDDTDTKADEVYPTCLRWVTDPRKNDPYPQKIDPFPEG